MADNKFDPCRIFRCYCNRYAVCYVYRSFCIEGYMQLCKDSEFRPIVFIILCKTDDMINSRHTFHCLYHQLFDMAIAHCSLKCCEQLVVLML